jgi:hypothetical protein
VHKSVSNETFHGYFNIIQSTGAQHRKPTPSFDINFHNPPTATSHKEIRNPKQRISQDNCSSFQRKRARVTTSNLPIGTIESLSSSTPSNHSFPTPTRARTVDFTNQSTAVIQERSDIFYQPVSFFPYQIHYIVDLLTLSATQLKPVHMNPPLSHQLLGQMY